MKQMIKLLPLILILLSCHTKGMAGTGSDMHACNEMYHKGANSDAINCYKDLATETLSPAILYNLGNSYAQASQPGKAILNYHRALCLSPGDSDILGNLSLVKQEQGLFDPKQSISQAIFSPLTINQWALLCPLSLAGYLTFSLYRARKPVKVQKELLAIILAILVFSLGVMGTAVKYKTWKMSVITSQDRLLLSPFENAASIGILEPGRLVAPEKIYKAYMYVTDETGKKGWIASESAEPIINHK